MKPITVNRFLLGWAVLATVAFIFVLNTKSCGSNKIVVSETIKGSIKAITVLPISVPTIVKVKVPGNEVIKEVPYTDSTYCKELAIDYLSQKEYKDTVGTDSVQVETTYWVSENNLDSSKSKIILNVPYIKTVNTTIIEPHRDKWKFYVGASVGTNGLGFCGGPELTLTDRNRMLYKIGVDFSTFSTPVYRVGFGVKLSFPKKPPIIPR